MGGSAIDSVAAVTTDQAGNVYLTGSTSSADFPVTTTFGASPAASTSSGFVAKLDPSGSTLVYSVLLGKGEPAAIALGPDGSVFVAGISSEMPTTEGAAVKEGFCFLLKLEPSGSKLVYSTRLGCSGSGSIPPGGLAMDSSGNAFVTGSNTGAATTPGAFKPNGYGAFVVKVNAAGSAILYGTYLPSGENYASAKPKAIAVDPEGNAYLTGSADARGFPVTQDTLPRERAAEGDTTADDVFLLKLSPDGARVVFAELFGGYGSDSGSVIALDAEGSIFIGGISRSSTGWGSRDPFPTTEGALDSLSAMPRGFLAKLTPDGRELLFSTFLPGADDAVCLGVGGDGVSVMTVERMKNQSPNLYADRLSRVSPDGGTLLSTSIAAFAAQPRCGSSGPRFALAGANGPLTSPNLSPIGTGGKGDVWFTAVDADVPEAPRLDVNAGALELYSWFGADGPTGNWPESLQVRTGDKSLPVLIQGGDYIKVEPEQGNTPLELHLHPSAGDLRDRLFVFAPGAQDGLVVIPVRERFSLINFAFDPAAFSSPMAPGLVQLAADSPDAPPVSGTLRISSPAVKDLFGGSTEAQVRFGMQPFGSVPAWLTMEGVPGTTPAEVRFTANGAGLAPRLYSVSFQMTSQDSLPWQGSLPTASVYFRIGAAPAALPVLAQSPQFWNLHLTDDQPTSSVTLHLDSTDGAPLDFTTDPIPDWIKVSPSAGTTPLDMTITTTPPRDVSTTWHQSIQFRSGNRGVGFVDITADVILGGFTGSLSVNSMNTKDASSVTPENGVAPGALFVAGLPRLMAGVIPETPEQADAWALAPSLAGYFFVLEGQPVPARSYAGGTFILQMPAGLAPGSHHLGALDTNGQEVAEAEVQLVAARPQILDQRVDNGNYARKEDGSQITPDNPVHTGDRILVRVTGQGAVAPAIPDGQAASVENPSKPILPVTAYTGQKPLTVLSAQMSTSEAGVLDVWVQIPELYEGDHFVSVQVGPLSAGVVPIRVAARPVDSEPGVEE
ncbi:SBBP repeat-containing protein [Paludibaculum fermentans]|uniref:SBBP repeat-containing protein n=1 Tax=Paludibaculum fermentans TaxID=1473598 RepID=UPI003EC080B3